ncbi:MAG: division/cell wall cluster transcriptional repressor MraZ [Hydrogenophilus sp.]|nr:division/cell wall cluster transcriptional repressor MraZ [Hydrogenophilus sp.]
MFQGAVALTLDAKGRLVVPKGYREELCPGGEALVMTAHPHRCVLLYPLQAWAPVRGEIAALPGLDPRTAAVKRLLLGFATETELDRTGRVLVAASLREWAGLKREVWLVGQGNHCELWSVEGWRQQQEWMGSLTTAELPEGLQGLRL